MKREDIYIFYYSNIYTYMYTTALPINSIDSTPLSPLPPPIHPLPVTTKSYPCPSSPAPPILLLRVKDTCNNKAYELTQVLGT